MPDQETLHGLAPAAKAGLWVLSTFGFAWTSYFAVPVVATTGYCILAQGQFPDLSFKDLANVGGFAIFAFAMYRLHVTTVAQHREDREKDRAQMDRMVDHLAANTKATSELNQTLKQK